MTPARYLYRVTFTKTFLTGVLSGCAYEDTLRFSSKDSALDWIDGVSKPRKDKKFSDFKVHFIFEDDTVSEWTVAWCPSHAARMKAEGIDLSEMRM